MNIPVHHTIENYAAGSVIFQQGETAHALYVVESGAVELRRQVHVDEHVLAVLTAGEFFGEMGLLNQRTRSATAVVRRDARVRVITAEDFRAFLGQQDSFLTQMLGTLASRLDQANYQTEIFMYEHPDNRMVQSLCHAIDEQVQRGEGGRGAVHVPLTLRELAARASVSLDEAVDVIERLANDGLIIPACAADIDDRGYVVAESELLVQYLDKATSKQHQRAGTWVGAGASTAASYRSDMN